MYAFYHLRNRSLQQRYNKSIRYLEDRFDTVSLNLEDLIRHVSVVLSINVWAPQGIRKKLSQRLRDNFPVATPTAVPGRPSADGRRLSGERDDDNTRIRSAHRARADNS